jgi:hypothetical protein
MLLAPFFVVKKSIVFVSFALRGRRSACQAGGSAAAPRLFGFFRPLWFRNPRKSVQSVSILCFLVVGLFKLPARRALFFASVEVPKIGNRKS